MGHNINKYSHSTPSSPKLVVLSSVFDLLSSFCKWTYFSLRYGYLLEIKTLLCICKDFQSDIYVFKGILK